MPSYLGLHANCLLVLMKRETFGPLLHHFTPATLFSKRTIWTLMELWIPSCIWMLLLVVVRLTGRFWKLIDSAIVPLLLAIQHPWQLRIALKVPTLAPFYD